MKKILVATDASEYSRKALIRALELARKFNSEVELLSVINLPEARPYAVHLLDEHVNWQERNEQEGELVLKATLEGINISGVTINKKVIQGKPANMIIQEIDNENINLVIMGSHGYGVVSGAILGSVSQRVLHGAKCSVLIVK